ncbi:Rho GTPase activation protein [Sporodiniella umbellata]|nr:Rho GTPase activation protein [Sporodiniella umbellata]
MTGGSTPTLHLYSSQPTPIQRSLSTRHEPRPGLAPHTTSTSRIETLKRALTTHRKTTDNKKSFSVNNPPLFISLPAIPLSTSSSPPLSPPSAVQHHQHVWTMPLYLPELNSTQDAILRHTALLFIERSTDEPFLPEDYWVETAKSVPAQSLWGKLKAHILTPNGSHTLDFPQPDPSEPRRIGVALYHLPSRALTQPEPLQDDALAAWVHQSPSVASCFSSRAQIPNFLKDCILCMINQDLCTEGIFRKNGNIRTLKDMCLVLDQRCETEGGWREFFSHQPIIQLAAFIKRFTRELPEPLLTFKLYKLFLIPRALHHALCLLPKPNRDTLFLILALLHWVAEKSEANRMDIDNLARVMTPNLLYPQKKPLQQLDMYGPEIQVVTDLIQNYARLMEVPSDMLHLLENPKLTEHVFSTNIDLTSTKQFTKHFHSLLSIKKDIIQEPLMPPSPSVSSSTFK